MTEEAFPEAAAILRDAGWKPHDGWGVYTRGTLVMGFSPDGQHFDVKNTASAPDSPDTPDDPVEAAHWLVRLRAPAVVIDDVVSYEPPTPLVDDQWPMEGLEPETRRPIHIEPPMPVFEETAEAAYGGEDETHGETGEAAEPQDDADEWLRSAGDSGRGGDEVDSEALGGGPEAATEADPIDADFAPIEDEPLERDALDADLFPIRGIAWSEDAEPEAEPDTTGPIAYAASDLDALVREKLGRVSQIARELKASLQDGWTIDEFRSLQNLIVRIDRGEASDDAEARARFVAISERSQAMSRVDAHRDALEAALDAIGKARDYQAAKDFNPEANWP